MHRAPWLVLAVVLGIGATAPPPAAASACTLDNVPAATLLLPYFEVDLDSLSGTTTVFSIHNAWPEATVAHIIFWTDWGAPTINFDVFLTGYDVVSVNLRDAFNGSLPVTATEAVDPSDSISPHGSNPEWDGDFPVCEFLFPYPDPVVSGGAFDRLVNGHTGQPVASLGGACLGADHGIGNVARGYVTIDDARECSLVLDPGDPEYFGTANPVVTRENQLWGDFFIVKPGNARAELQPLVAIEADPDFDSSSTPTNYTFYGRFTQGAGGNDNREPLGAAWGGRFLDRQTGTSSYTVWRDPTADNLLLASGGAPCAAPGVPGPDWLPLQENRVTCFDEEENVVELCGPTTRGTDPACFPLATQRVRVGTGELDLPFSAGWCQLDLGIPGDSPSGDVDFPASPPGDVAQSWVGVRYDLTTGSYSAGLQAVELEHACDLPAARALIAGGNAR